MEVLLLLNKSRLILLKACKSLIDLVGRWSRDKILAGFGRFPRIWESLRLYRPIPALPSARQSAGVAGPWPTLMFNPIWTPSAHLPPQIPLEVSFLPPQITHGRTLHRGGRRQPHEPVDPGQQQRPPVVTTLRRRPHSSEISRLPCSKVMRVILPYKNVR